MRPKLIFSLFLVLGALAALILVVHPVNRLGVEPQPAGGEVALKAPDSSSQEQVPEQMSQPIAAGNTSKNRTLLGLPGLDISITNKLERLAQIREIFHQLASGEPAAALQAAKQIRDPNERETALLTLASEWTHGELRSPHERARAIEMYGLEAGLGMELAGNPELALTWANNLTDGSGRQAVLAQTAVLLTGSDPAAAFALGDQLPEDQRRRFLDSLFAGWADKDTEAALRWANQISDPAEHDAALQAIRTTAPAGIGTALAVQDGYPVVQQLLPGAPAELSGQIHAGDRIVALAQGDNEFLDVHGVPLQQLIQMIRGAPGTPLQLQILAGDAPPNAPPQTISIVRDQIKWKH